MNRKMEFYKKILKSQNLRFKILDLLSWLPDELMLKIQYRIKLNRWPNFKAPKRYTEKLQCYKMTYRNEIMHKCVDKYLVREYIESKGLKNILNDCYGVYDRFDEIQFESLPNEFVIKATNGGGGQNIIICNDKNAIDYAKIKQTVDGWLNNNPKKSWGREWAYETNSNKIIVEKLLKGNENNLTGINDYKFLCFNGKVEYIVFDGDRYKEHKRNFYDKDWNYIEVGSDCKTLGDIIEKPKGLDEMKKVAEILSKDFPFVRVDLYFIDNKVYFGELTFYPWSGYVQYDPDEFDYILGDKFSIGGK